jgi:hypothetical protein
VDRHIHERSYCGVEESDTLSASFKVIFLSQLKLKIKVIRNPKAAHARGRAGLTESENQARWSLRKSEIIIVFPGLGGIYLKLLLV